jgi:hypothetical protein
MVYKGSKGSMRHKQSFGSDKHACEKDGSPQKRERKMAAQSKQQMPHPSFQLASGCSSTDEVGAVHLLIRLLSHRSECFQLPLRDDRMALEIRIGHLHSVPTRLQLRRKVGCKGWGGR